MTSEPLSPETLIQYIMDYRRICSFFMTVPHAGGQYDEEYTKKQEAIARKFAGAIVELEHIFSSVNNKDSLIGHHLTLADKVADLENEVRLLRKENEELIRHSKPMLDVLEARAAWWERKHDNLCSKIQKLLFEAWRNDDLEESPEETESREPMSNERLEEIGNFLYDPNTELSLSLYTDPSLDLLEYAHELFDEVERTRKAR